MKRFRKILLVAIALACSLPAWTQEKVELRVMSMNVKCGGEYAHYSPDGFIELIREWDPDVVCLQEVDYRTIRNRNQDWLGKIAVETGLFPYFSSSFPYQGGGFGNALLSRYPFYRARKVITPKSRLEGEREDRSTAWIYLELPGGAEVRVATCHLALQTPQNTVRHMADINEHLFAEDKEIPTLLIGDFNADEIDTPIDYIKNLWQDIGRGTGYTIPSDKPSKRLDYVMGYPKKWKASSYQIIARPDLSDHCFIVADVSIEL